MNAPLPFAAEPWRGPDATPAAAARRLRLETLTRLRWIAVGGQSAAVAVVAFGFGFEMPLIACVAVIGLSALLNLGLSLRFPATQRLSHGAALALLGYDASQLAVLLCLTGGLESPFAVLLIVPVVISASALPPAATVGLGLYVLALAGGLVAFHLPLPWWPGETFDLPALYVAGVAVAIVSTLAFTAIYAWRVADEARQLSNALAATELALAREQHLSALDGLAAAAAHELGTPLSTIALVVNELAREAPESGDYADDLRLLRSQVERCRAILRKIGQLGETADGPLARLPLTSLVEEVAAPHRDFGVEIAVRAAEGAGPEPVGRRDPAVLHGLGNLVENAVDFARGRVEITAGWSADDVTLAIADDGPGFAPEALERIGEPYYRPRPRTERQRRANREAGLGLGFFIAKTLLERSGARLTVSNRAFGATGAVVAICWPRARFEAARDEATRVRLDDPAGA